VGTQEFLVFGPYISAPKGRYYVHWKVNLPVEVGESEHLPAFWVDIATGTGGETLIAKHFSLADIRAANGIARLDFEIVPDRVKDFQIRAYSLGLADFYIEMKRQVFNQLGQLVYTDADFFEGESEVATEPVLIKFMADHIQSMCGLRQWGVRFLVEGQSLKGIFGGCAFHILNKEDFQIFQEVFIQKDYDVELPGELVVADVGMNVGYASLRFASMTWVKEVHSFEPFEFPFRRAIKNFNLNPALKSKIFPNGFGLFDANLQRAVRYDDTQTISTSVRGAGSGAEVIIHLREASSILGPIIRNAKAMGHRFMLKLDCEGSEFPIIENLHSTKLLKEVDILLLEWHKWWDHSKSQRSLIEPLLEDGFLILDRTRDDNPHAGVIMACRIL
jgi:FkbM family methyltransferase